jgi:hypothetical protein
MKSFEVSLETRNVINKTEMVVESYTKKLRFLIEFTENELKSITIFPGKDSSMNMAKGFIIYLLKSNEFDGFFEEGGDIEEISDDKVIIKFMSGELPISMLPKLSFMLSSPRFEAEVFKYTTKWIIDNVDDTILSANLINEL